MADNLKKETKNTRMQYYMTQLTPCLKLIGGLALGLATIGGVYLKVPQVHSVKPKVQALQTLETQYKTLKGNYQNLELQFNTLNSDINELRTQKENEGSLRFYIKDLSAYCRYIETLAKNTKMGIISLDIDNVTNKVTYTVLGEYANIVNFMNGLETREIYYVENVKLTPSYVNSGTYVTFTSNFNIEQTLIDRYPPYTDYSNPSPVAPTQTNNTITSLPDSNSNEQNFSEESPSRLISDQLQSSDDTIIIN